MYMIRNLFYAAHETKELPTPDLTYTFTELRRAPNLEQAELAAGRILTTSTKYG